MKANNHTFIDSKTSNTVFSITSLFASVTTAFITVGSNSLFKQSISVIPFELNIAIKFIDKEKEELKNANLELKEKVLRITADMQNMRRRYDLDLAQAYKYDGFDLVEKILPILVDMLKIYLDMIGKYVIFLY